MINVWGSKSQRVAHVFVNIFFGKKSLFEPINSNSRIEHSVRGLCVYSTRLNTLQTGSVHTISYFLCIYWLQSARNQTAFSYSGHLNEWNELRKSLSFNFAIIWGTKLTEFNEILFSGFTYSYWTYIAYSSYIALHFASPIQIWCATCNVQRTLQIKCENWLLRPNWRDKLQFCSKPAFDCMKSRYQVLTKSMKIKRCGMSYVPRIIPMTLYCLDTALSYAIRYTLTWLSTCLWTASERVCTVPDWVILDR